MTALPELLVDGRLYAGWTSVRVTRGVEKMAASFALEVTEAWPGQDQPWVIRPGSPCRLTLGGLPVIDGHVDEYAPSFSASDHRVTVVGRSRTADLVDASVLAPGGQFRGYDLARIARALAEPFGIPVRVETDVGAGFPDVQVQQGESCFDLIDRLAVLRGVLATDGPDGALVLVRAGGVRAAGRLVQGGAQGNILEASARLSHARRWSRYVVKGQRAGGDGLSGDAAAAVVAEAVDPAVRRYRPKVIVAEAQADAASAAARARWEALGNAGKGVSATVTVQGWMQAPDRLWAANEMVSIDAPWLGLDRELLVAEVEYRLDEGGTRTELTLAPPEAFTPEPPRPGSSGGGVGGKGDLWRDVRPIG